MLLWLLFIQHKLELVVDHDVDGCVDRRTLQWGDRGSPIFYELFRRSDEEGDCAEVYVNYNMKIKSKTFDLIKCDGYPPDGYVCMKPNSVRSKVRVQEPLSVHLEKATKNITQFPTRQCPDGSLVQLFHRCYHETKQKTIDRSSHSVVLFVCRYGPPVHYTLVCDGNADCVHANDEAECGPVKFPPLLDSMFRCDQFQLIPKLQQCDGKTDCFDGSDENSCSICNNDPRRPVLCVNAVYRQMIDKCKKIYTRWDCKSDCHNCSQVMVFMDGFGGGVLQPTNNSNMEGTFLCRDRDYYIPSFLLNNGELDCKYGDDENIPLTNFTCPGFYRCRDSYSCVHPIHVCDGIHHCPYKDDERYCDFVCPEGCLCEGYAFSCTQFSAHPGMLLARYLDLSGSQNLFIPETIQYQEVLQYLNLSRCNLSTVILRNVSNLRHLDFSLNNIKTLSSIVFENLFQMKYLDASHNSLVHVLDVSFWNFIKQSGLNNLQRLVFRNTDLRHITDRALSQLTHLEFLDIRDNSIDSHDRQVFWGLDSLQHLYTDDFNLCCPYFHSSDTVDCVAPFDELSSCSDLLRLNFFRIFLWLMALLAILGNSAVGMYHLFGGKQRTLSSFRVLVSNLCVADLIMGVYMTMIGIADAQFRGQYVAKEKAWKRNVKCIVAGFLGFVSCEASALTICVITLDRVLVVCFPLKTQIHLAARSSLAACGLVWFVAVTLAALPLLAGLQFYGVNSICLPLPITRRQYSGEFYSFGVFIVFNFVIFVLIGLGQALIYLAILRTSKAVGTDRKAQEMTIARRLFLVIVSDFCCWFPIGMMGILAASDVPIPDEVNVWAAIFIIPLNSDLNPFMYTLSSFREKWRAEQLEIKTSKFLTSIPMQLPKMLPSSVEELVRACVRSNVVKRERVLHILQTQQEV